MDRCLEAENWLHRELDGELTPSEGARLQDHLDQCAECCHLAKDLRRLMDATETLTPSIEPTRDLWPEIGQRLEQRKITENPRRSLWTHRGLQAIAALLLITVGVWLGRLTASPTSDQPTPSSVPSSMALAATNSLAQIEADLLRAREGLWLELLARHDEIDPQLLGEVARNFRIINRATEDVRQALSRQPGEPELEALLLAQYKHEIELLRHFVRLTA